MCAGLDSFAPVCQFDIFFQNGPCLSIDSSVNRPNQSCVNHKVLQIDAEETGTPNVSNEKMHRYFGALEHLNYFACPIGSAQRCAQTHVNYIN
eukprot:m.131581 g.131581  ORF g.131581 m.131581 type:complete len:93 (-) comp13762_c1_seq1:111-389(-)